MQVVWESRRLKRSLRIQFGNPDGPPSFVQLSHVVSLDPVPYLTASETGGETKRPYASLCDLRWSV